MKGSGGRLWPWVVVPLLLVAAIAAAVALALPDGGGLSGEGGYRVR